MKNKTNSKWTPYYDKKTKHDIRYTTQWVQESWKWIQNLVKTDFLTDVFPKETMTKYFAG